MSRSPKITELLLCSEPIGIAGSVPFAAAQRP